MFDKTVKTFIQMGNKVFFCARKKLTVKNMPDILQTLINPSKIKAWL